jgi:hypothetical protein
MLNILNNKELINHKKILIKITLEDHLINIY